MYKFLLAFALGDVTAQSRSAGHLQRADRSVLMHTDRRSVRVFIQVIHHFPGALDKCGNEAVQNAQVEAGVETLPGRAP